MCATYTSTGMRRLFRRANEIDADPGIHGRLAYILRGWKVAYAVPAITVLLP
jgi:hypothetical protein